MRLATRYDEIHESGAELAAISVDDNARQAGMATRWGLTHTTMVSDPGGETYLKPLGLFDPNERGGIALPGMVIVDPDGNEIYRYQGRDFADRTNDDDLFEALDALQLDPIEPEPWVPEASVPDDLKGYFGPDFFGVYFRGNMFAAAAIGGRLENPEAKAIADEHRRMAKSSLDAWDQWKVTLR